MLQWEEITIAVFSVWGHYFIQVLNSWGMYFSQKRGEVAGAQELRNSIEIRHQNPIKVLTFYSAGKKLPVGQT